MFANNQLPIESIAMEIMKTSSIEYMEYEGNLYTIEEFERADGFSQVCCDLKHNINAEKSLE